MNLTQVTILTKLRTAVALHNRGQLEAASVLYDEILLAQPRHFDALHLLGVIAAQTGNPRRAVDVISKALEIVPNNAAAHKNCGAALQELGQLPAAIASYERAIALVPGYAEAHYCRGNAFKDAKRWEDAIACYDTAILLDNAYAEALGNRGVCLAELQRLESALESYGQALLVKTDYVEAHYNSGIVLCRLRRWQEALHSFDRAIALRPAHAAAYCDRAFALLELARSDEALASCDQAIGLDQRSVQGHANRAGVLMSMQRADEAVASYDRALAISPANASAYVNRGMARLSIGDFIGGWSDYEWRWKDRDGWIILEKRNCLQPQWLGQASLAGCSILLQAEQGYGDTIQFCRFAKLVAELGARVILEVPAALASLLRALDGVSQLLIQGEAVPSFDYHCPLLSLPLALGTRLDTVPAAVPYLRPSDEHRRRWQERLGARSRPRVGLVWSGGFRPNRPELWSMNERRSIPLQSLATLSHCGAQFYSLQTGELAESQLAALTAHDRTTSKIIDLTRDIRDFADTAALIEQLDLVVSVDTATAHLAGALGKPVWILNRFDACWRWLRNRTDSPWYPTARLYQQERAGDWDGVLDRVSADLTEFLGTHPLHHTG